MSHLLRRLHSTTTTTHPPTAQELASQFLQRAHSQPPPSQSQLLDLNQLQRLASSLSQPKLPSYAQAVIPASHHLVYFTPDIPSSHLGPDGADQSYNPGFPFTRRMWAGGEMLWRGKENLLRVGQLVMETTRVRDVLVKRSGSGGGEEMLVVGVEKELVNQGGWAVRDRRNWIFRPALSSSSSSPTSSSNPIPRPHPIPFPAGKYTKDITQNLANLFRFSALTFNAHKIHYSREWCREMEGQRDCVVHGPLNLMLMVDFWREVMMMRFAAGVRGEEMEMVKAELVPRRVEYKALSPVFVDEAYRIILDEESQEGVSEVRIMDLTGTVCMKGKIERFMC